MKPVMEPWPWISSNGVVHIALTNYPCITCGRKHRKGKGQ